MVTNGEILKGVFSNGKYTEEQQKSTLSNALRIYSKMPNPDNDITSNVGLVVGRVQSGKTANIITLSALALDNDYKVVILFLSDTNNLLTQNTGRFLKTFEGIDDVFVLKKSSDGDFNAKIDQQTLSYLYGQEQKLIICSLKHSLHIDQITDLLSQSPYKDDYALIIDDEGDDIGLNTARFDDKFVEGSDGEVVENERTATNRAIVRMKQSLNKVGYISLTATPEANILLQSFQQLAPDYCVTMKPNKGYTGLLTFHGEDSDKTVEIKDKEWMLEDNGLPESFADAFTFFVAGCIVKTARATGKKKKKEKHSMMVHPCHKIDNHQLVYEKIKRFVDNTSHNLSVGNQSGKIFSGKVIEQISILEKDLPVDVKTVADTVSTIRCHLVNSREQCNDLHQTMGLTPYHIVVGGNMLDRGITIDGLAVTYMIRMAKTGQADTLLQRARWFGYKESYIDLCRVYMPKELITQFEKLIEIEESVWEFLNMCDEQNLVPKDIDAQFSVPSGMKIAAANKGNYIITNLLAPVKAQSEIVHDSKLNDKNVKLIGGIDWTGAEIKEYSPSQIHRRKTISARELDSLISQFHFSENDHNSFGLPYIQTLMKEHKFKLVDLWDIRYNTGEKRSTEDYRVKALLQGYSEGKRKGDDGYYVGDRNLKTSILSVQIHHVFLKNDIDDQYKTGDEVIMLAIVFPEKYMGGLVAARMSKEDILTKIRAKATVQNAATTNIVPVDANKAMNSIYLCTDGKWYMNIHNPYTGDIDAAFDGKLKVRKEFDKCEQYVINGPFVSDLLILSSGNKKALFALAFCYGMQGGAFACTEPDPYTFDEVEVYRSPETANDYGYAACLKDGKWRLYKVTQFPAPKCELMASNQSSVEDAFTCIGEKFSDFENITKY